MLVQVSSIFCKYFVAYNVLSDAWFHLNFDNILRQVGRELILINNSLAIK